MLDLQDAAMDVPAGLAGVRVARTRLSDVDGAAGVYHYRGRDAVGIAEGHRFEDVWSWIWNGALPAPSDFVEGVAAARAIDPDVAARIPVVAGASTAPGSLDTLRTAVSLAGQVIGCRSWLEQPLDDTRRQALRIAAMLPGVAAALWRLGRGWSPLEADPGLGHAADYLRMIHGAPAEPERVEALERYLSLSAEHGFNNSAFTARVVSSSGADVAAAVSAAIGAFSGPLHGGAVARVPTMLDDIAASGDVEGWVREALAHGERLMGFGHPVYEAPDPRVRSLRALAERLGGDRVALAMEVERTAVRLINDRFPGKRREANVDFYAGVVLEQAGVPEELFGATFAVARVVGWTAHVLEQVEDNRIFRPAAAYVH